MQASCPDGTNSRLLFDWPAEKSYRHLRCFDHFHAGFVDTRIVLCYDIQSTIFSSASLAAFVQIIYNASSTSRSLDTHPPTPHIWLMCWKELLQQLDPSLFIDGLLGQPFVEIKEGLLASPQCHSSTSTSRSSAIAALLLLLLLPLSAEHYVPPHFIIRLARDSRVDTAFSTRNCRYADEVLPVGRRLWEKNLCC